MGIVYKAFQISLDRTVALKVLPPGISLSESAVKNFKREATTVAALSHANIVPVHAVGEARGVHYFAMDLIEGCAVDRVIDALRGCDPADLSKPELSEALATRPWRRRAPNLKGSFDSMRAKSATWTPNNSGRA